MKWKYKVSQPNWKKLYCSSESHVIVLRKVIAKLHHQQELNSQEVKTLELCLLMDEYDRLLRETKQMMNEE